MFGTEYYYSASKRIAREREADRKASSKSSRLTATPSA